jgi:hypothetical protein
MNHPAHTIPSTRLSWPLLAGFAALCLTGLLFPQSAAASMAPTHGQIQERLGQTILMVTQHDQELLQAHLDQMTGLMHERSRFQEGRSGRLQEALGQSVVNTAQAIQRERLDLMSRIMIDQRELGLLSEDSPAGRQTQLGFVVRTAALRAAQDGTAFQTELGQEITRIEKVRQRTIGRLQAEVLTLQRQEAALPLTIPERYKEAMAFTLQRTQMADQAYLASVDQQVRELSQQVLQRQSPLLYARLAEITRESLAPSAGVGGFVEYGLAALVGAIGVMVWFGLSSRRGTISWIPGAPTPHRRLSDV